MPPPHCLLSGEYRHEKTYRAQHGRDRFGVICRGHGPTWSPLQPGRRKLRFRFKLLFELVPRAILQSRRKFFFLVIELSSFELRKLIKLLELPSFAEFIRFIELHSERSQVQSRRKFFFFNEYNSSRSKLQPESLATIIFSNDNNNSDVHTVTLNILNKHHAKRTTV